MGKSNFFLVIAGNIGVGKTTFTRLLSERLGWQPYFEKVKGNPYLGQFYNDMRRWGFHSQIYFLTQRFKAHIRINQINIPVIQDRSIYEDAEVFAANLYQQGLFSEQDYHTYRELYESMLHVLRPPDLTVYLRGSPWTLLSRIRRRWRDEERNIDKEYLFQLNLAYEKWIKNWRGQYPVQIINTDGHDFLKEDDWTRENIDRIYETFKKESLLN